MAQYSSRPGGSGRSNLGANNLSPGGRLAIAAGVVLVLLAFAGTFFFKSIPAGHVGVATLFGEPRDVEYQPGMHFPVNPLLGWVEYDTREMTHMEEQVGVPSQDQLTTRIDVSVQWRIDGGEASRILSETGEFEKVVDVLLIPKLRSLMREQGKSVIKAEDFFNETTQARLQDELYEKLGEYLAPKGVIVNAVLLREFTLPPTILTFVEQKKQADQKIEQTRSELEQAKIEAQRRVEEAKAEREAAEQTAEMKKVLADAQAYEINAINEAIAQNPAYIQLEALKALQAMSKDEAAKLYFMNSDSPMPLPLMNLGEPLGNAGGN